jgi:hypothetical protein
VEDDDFVHPANPNKLPVTKMKRLVKRIPFLHERLNPEYAEIFKSREKIELQIILELQMFDGFFEFKKIENEFDGFPNILSRSEIGVGAGEGIGPGVGRL